MTCHKLRADLVAGLTVGVMVIPQSMSYGAIAGCLGRLGRLGRGRR
jgi:MFS superfamily sulfate permease-like transporter